MLLHQGVSDQEIVATITYGQQARFKHCLLSVSTQGVVASERVGGNLRVIDVGLRELAIGIQSNLFRCSSQSLTSYGIVGEGFRGHGYARCSRSDWLCTGKPSRRHCGDRSQSAYQVLIARLAAQH